MLQPRIYLSPPHLAGDEWDLVRDAFESGWIAPLGPHVTAFETEFAKQIGAAHAVAVNSGTSALHLALQLAGIGPSHAVLVPTFTFVASVNPVRYLAAEPVFLDSETTSWNIDPALLEDALRNGARRGRLPAAVIVAHLYGQCADLDRIAQLCQEFGVHLMEDAAEALGSRYKDVSPGTFGEFGIFSFNGNKIITTSGGGMLVTDNAEWAERARKLATQARDAAPHYEHSEVGYNYRLSNLLAAVGRGQLRVLEDRVRARRRNFNYYKEHLRDLPGVSFQPEAPWGRHSRWLTTLLIEPTLFGADREAVRLALNAENIEARPLWKPMHLQPLYRDCRVLGGSVAEELFEKGLCLPSGSAMTETDLNRVVEIVRTCQDLRGRRANLREPIRSSP